MEHTGFSPADSPGQSDATDMTTSGSYTIQKPPEKVRVAVAPGWVCGAGTFQSKCEAATSKVKACVATLDPASNDAGQCDVDIVSVRSSAAVSVASSSAERVALARLQKVQSEKN